MFCPHCGLKIDEESKFCPGCGEDIDPDLAEYIKAEQESDNPPEANNLVTINIDTFNEKPSYKQTEEEKVSVDEDDNSDKKSKRLKPLLIIAGIIVVAAVVGVLFLTGVFSSSRNNDSTPKKEADNVKTLLQLDQEEKDALSVGDVFYFGTYEQDDDIENGKEVIAWQILSKDGSSVMAITKDLIDCMPYNTDSQSLFWDDCTLQRWLNNEFIQEAFEAEEEALLQTHISVIKKNEMVGAVFQIVETPVEEKVFILNTEEAESLFSSDEARVAEPTEYAISQMRPYLNVTNENIDINGNVKRTDGTDNQYEEYAIRVSSWWLRKEAPSDSYFDMHVQGVDHDGVIDTVGPPGLEYVCIRPVIVITFDEAANTQNANSTDSGLLTQEENTTTQEINDGSLAPGLLYSTVDELMFRTGPGTEYPAIAKLSKGDVIDSFESVNGWAHGYYNGVEGWASEQYLKGLAAADSSTVDYSVLENAIQQFDPMNLGDALYSIGPYNCVLRGEDDTYAYYQAYAGGGWEMVKVKKTAPYSVEYMNDIEKNQYEQRPNYN